MWLWDFFARSVKSYRVHFFSALKESFTLLQDGSVQSVSIK